MTHSIKLLKSPKIIIPILFSLVITVLFLSKSDSTILGLFVLAALCFGYFFCFTLNKPEFGILSSLFSMAFMVSYYEEMFFSLYIVYVAVLLAGLLYTVSHFSRSKIFYFLLFWIFLYYSIFLIIPRYEYSYVSWLVIMIALLSIFIWTSLIKWNKERIFFIVIIYGSYLIVWGILEKIIYEPQRVSGPTGFATNYAILLSVLWTICFVNFCIEKKQGLFIIFWSIGILFCIFLSGTRLGIIGMLLGTFFGLCIWFFKTNKETSIFKRIIKIAGILLVFGGGVYLAWSMLPNDLYIVKNLNILLSGKIDNSTLGRLTAWYAAWDAFSNNIIWGKGPGHFLDIHGEFLNKLPPMPVKKLPVAHNEILNILAESGLAGFLHVSVIVAICLFIVINHIKKNPGDSIAIALLFAFFVLFALMMFDSSPSRGFDPWLLGVFASFGIAREK